mmetsp:Transcript_70693/g.206988  ORF Transcript_70693/g.206988 Transcript_70693/m.206988 type:complete len:473 (+) Transcript_70693:83-1501(+)
MAVPVPPLWQPGAMDLAPAPGGFSWQPAGWMPTAAPVPTAVPAYADYSWCQSYASAEPGAEEEESVQAFLLQLGIQPEEEELFRWIAELGLLSPLPPQWSHGQDPSTGYTYYYDEDQKVSSWENPLVPHLQRIVELGRECLQAPSESFFEDAKQTLWREREQDLASWHGPFSDSDGREYFVNSKHGVTSMQDPRVDAQYIYDLQKNFLSSLEEVLLSDVASVDDPATGSLASGSPRQWPQRAGSVEDSPPPRTTAASPPPPATWSTPRKLATLQLNTQVDHRDTLRKMQNAAARLYLMCDEDAEVQKIMLKRQAEARRAQRRATSSSAPAGGCGGLAGRPAPAALGLDEGASMPLPPERGAPSAANRPQPPPSPWAPRLPQSPEAKTPCGEPPALATAFPGVASRPSRSSESIECPPEGPLQVPQSPSLHGKQPGRRWAAEAFLASTLAGAAAGGQALPPVYERQPSEATLA